MIEELKKISSIFRSREKWFYDEGNYAGFKDSKTIIMNPRGTMPTAISEESILFLDRQMVNSLYSSSVNDNDPEFELNKALARCKFNPSQKGFPPIWTILYERLKTPFFLHIRNFYINAVCCSRNFSKHIKSLFGDLAIAVDFNSSMPVMLENAANLIEAYRDAHSGNDPIVFLGNNGVILSQHNVEALHVLHGSVFSRISEMLALEDGVTETKHDADITAYLPLVRSALSTPDSMKVCISENNQFIQKAFNTSDTATLLSSITGPHHMYRLNYGIAAIPGFKPREFPAALKKKINAYYQKWEINPSVLYIQDKGLVSAGSTLQEAAQNMSAAMDLVKSVWYCHKIGDVSVLSEKDIRSIHQQEYELLPELEETDSKRLNGKVFVLTNEQHAGSLIIASALYSEGANVVLLARLDDEFLQRLNEVKAHTQSDGSIKCYDCIDFSADTLHQATRFIIKNYGGIDVFISNGASSPENVTNDVKNSRENSTNDFIRFHEHVHIFSRSMKQMHTMNDSLYFDIIKINRQESVAYSFDDPLLYADKKASTGLVESLALKLASSNIKVNAVQPENLFDSPYWSDAESGVFKKILSDKVYPHCKNISELKRYLESDIPLKRCCTYQDVFKAVLYVIEQKYETGSVLSVSGGSRIHD